MKKRTRKILPSLIVLIIISGGIVLHKQDLLLPQASSSSYDDIKNQYEAFVAEGYDVIQKEYWEVRADEELSELFRLAYNFVTQEEKSLITPDRLGVQALVQSNIESLSEEEKKRVVTEMLHVVLQNLRPAGRSALFTVQKEQELRNTVANRNPDTSLYENLGLEEGAESAQIEEAYQKKKAELQGDTSPEAQEELEKIEYTKEVLLDEAQKEQYDETGSEPTVFARTISDDTVHMKIKQFSPYTFNEFIRASDSIIDDSLTTLILDLRGNIGGAVDTLPYFLGPFIGPGQYAYDFLHQDEYIPYKTAVGWLPSLEKYKRVVVLTDSLTQSSGEIMAGSLKKYNVGILLGETTRGHGTIENTFPLTTTLQGDSYSLFLVHSITLRPDGQPIEGRGVDPHISLSDSSWDAELNQYFNDPSLIGTIQTLLDPIDQE